MRTWLGDGRTARILAIAPRVLRRMPYARFTTASNRFRAASALLRPPRKVATYGSRKWKPLTACRHFRPWVDGSFDFYNGLARMSERSGRETESGFHYLAFLPPSENSGGSVVVYLHGIGERGEDLSLVKRYGLPALLAGGRASINCPVICPQLESGSNWEPRRVARFIRAVAAEPLKTVLIGYSLGACGVCEVIGRFGAVVGQAVAIAGRAPHQAEVSQTGVSFLAIQGELDSWPSTASFVESVSSLGGRASSVTLPGQGHYVSEQAVLHSSCASALQAVGVKITVSQNAG